MEGKLATTCCCNPAKTEVEKRAFSTAINGVMVNAFSMMWFYFPTTPSPFFSVHLHFLLIFLYMSIIRAQNKPADAKLYLPYLTIMGIFLALGIPFAIWVATYQIVVAIILSIALILNGYFYSIIYGAFKCLQKEGKGNSIVSVAIDGKNQQNVFEKDKQNVFALNIPKY